MHSEKGCVHLFHHKLTLYFVECNCLNIRSHFKHIKQKITLPQNVLAKPLYLVFTEDAISMAFKKVYTL